MKKLMLLLLLMIAPLTARELGKSAQLEVEDWLIRARVGAPARHRNLALYPVSLPARGLPNYHSLDQAMALGSLRIGETSDSGSVNELRIENRGDLPVFIMAGEILQGARQDRVLQDDIWLGARSDPKTVRAFCVEKGRWGYNDDQSRDFEKSRPVAANVAVRAAARETGDQSAVWGSVEKSQASAGYIESTNLGKTFDDPAVKARLSGYLDALGTFARENPEARGVVVQVGNRLVAVDLFGDRAGFVLKFKKLLPAYALEAANAGGDSADVNVERATTFLRRTAGATWTVKSTPGEGNLLGASDSDLTGSALVVGGVVVHLEAFPRL